MSRWVGDGDEAYHPPGGAARRGHRGAGGGRRAAARRPGGRVADGERATGPAAARGRAGPDAERRHPAGQRAGLPRGPQPAVVARAAGGGRPAAGVGRLADAPARSRLRHRRPRLARPRGAARARRADPLRQGRRPGGDADPVPLPPVGERDGRAGAGLARAISRTRRATAPGRRRGPRGAPACRPAGRRASSASRPTGTAPSRRGAASWPHCSPATPLPARPGRHVARARAPARRRDRGRQRAQPPALAPALAVARPRPAVRRRGDRADHAPGGRGDDGHGRRAGPGGRRHHLPRALDRRRRLRRAAPGQRGRRRLRRRAARRARPPRLRRRLPLDLVVPQLRRHRAGDGAASPPCASGWPAAGAGWSATAARPSPPPRAAVAWRRSATGSPTRSACARRRSGSPAPSSATATPPTSARASPC